MKKPVCLLFLLLFAAGLSAETILIFTLNAVEMADGPSRDIVQFQSLVEDGIMSVIFDNDHIVFNAGIIKDNIAPGRTSERLSVRLAKNGGASWLVEVDIQYIPDEDSYRPVSAVYRLYDLSMDSLITDGEIFMDDVRTVEKQKADEMCGLLGEGIAYNILRWVKTDPVVKNP